MWQTLVISFFFKGGEVGVDGEVAPPPAAKEPGFSFLFWIRIFGILSFWGDLFGLNFVGLKYTTCGKRTRFYLFPTCLGLLDGWICCRLFSFEAVCVFRAEALMCAEKGSPKLLRSHAGKIDPPPSRLISMMR